MSYTIFTTHAAPERTAALRWNPTAKDIEPSKGFAFFGPTLLAIPLAGAVWVAVYCLARMFI